MKRQNTAKFLELLVANTYALYLKTQNYHWNVTGSNFKSLHELFETQYEDLAEAVDLLAERLRALDFKVKANFNFFLEKTLIQQDVEEHNFADTQMLQELIKGHIILVDQIIHPALEAAEQEKDEATANILAERIETHEKFVWMMKALLS